MISDRNFSTIWSETCKCQGITTSQTMVQFSNRTRRKIIWNSKSILFTGNYQWNLDLNFDCCWKWAAVTFVGCYRPQVGIALKLRRGCSHLHQSNFFQYWWIFSVFEPRAWFFLDFRQNFEKFAKILRALSKITATILARNHENPTIFVPKNQNCSH